jgi:hypothetical protein
MNIGISELIALDVTVNKIAHLYHLPLSVAAFHLFNEIIDYNTVKIKRCG